jgi:Fur family peroxide stress response transcriptional regulator
MIDEFEKVISRLRKKGYVLSMPRMVIIKYLLSNKNHHTAESIHKAISKDYPSISVATIYNTLKLLTKEGFLKQLFIEGEKVFYDSTPGFHSHFICRICGKIKDVSEKPKKICKINGDRVEEVYVYYYGLCEECKKGRKN